MKLYVIFPAFNEEKALPPLLESLADFLETYRFDHQIIVVDDGSSDTTRKTALSFQSRLSLEVVSHKTNQGLAAAVRTGIDHVVAIASENDILVTMDADNTHAPGLMLQMIQKIYEGYDIVIASRYQKEARTLGVPVVRQVMSRMASIIAGILYPIRGVRDYTCGYRAYKISLLKTALAQHSMEQMIEESGFSCMIELLIKLQKFQPVSTEVPFLLRYDLKPTASKMDVGHTALKTFLLLLKFRFGKFR